MDINEKIKNLNELEFPEGLHGKIMRKLAFLQFRTPFIVVVTLLLLNLLFSGWNIWLRLSDTDAISTFRLMLEGFEWNFSSISQLASAAGDLFPMGLMVSFTINILLFVYILYVMKSYQKLRVSWKK